MANFLMTKVSTPIDKHAEDDRLEVDMTFMEHLLWSIYCDPMRP